MSEKDTSLQSLAKNNPLTSFWINSSIILAASLFIFGIFSPLMTVTKFYIFDDEISIISGLGTMFEKGEYLLFFVIGIFSIIIPIIKLILLSVIWNSSFPKGESWQKNLHRMSKYGKWSMLDVFVVSVFFVAIKLGMVMQVELHMGLYSFCASIIMSMIITTRIIYSVSYEENIKQVDN